MKGHFCMFILPTAQILESHRKTANTQNVVDAIINRESALEFQQNALWDAFLLHLVTDYIDVTF